MILTLYLTLYILANCLQQQIFKIQYKLMKKGYKQYEKQIKVNQNNDMFTTYQKPHSNSQHHHINSKDISSQSSQHHHIQSLKNTLKSINQINSLEITKPIQRKYDPFIDQGKTELVDNFKYNLKLTQLSKNLQEIASKCHFSHNNSAILKNRAISNNISINMTFQPNTSSQLITLPQKKSHLKNPLTYQLTNLNKSNQIIRNDKSSSKNKSMNIEPYNNKSSNKDLKLGRSKSRLSDSKQIIKFKQKSKDNKDNKDNNLQLIDKYLDKKVNINQQILFSGISKNLTKIFQNQLQKSNKYKYKYKQNNSTNTNNNNYNKNRQYIFKQKIHKNKITNILLLDHIYTSSLDYTINKIEKKDQEYQLERMAIMRGGINHIGFISKTPYTCSRDSYLRSLNNHFYCKFTSIPLKFYQSQRDNQITINFFNKSLSNFDLQKRNAISVLALDQTYQMIQKNSKQIFLGGYNYLSAIDWRFKHHIIDLVKFNEGMQCKWMSDPCSSSFCYENQNQIFALDDHYKTVKNTKISPQSTYKTYDWNRGGHYILGSVDSTDICKVWKFDSNLNSEQIDIQSKGKQVQIIKIKDKKIFYGCSDGYLMIKSLKR